MDDVGLFLLICYSTAVVVFVIACVRLWWINRCS